MRSPPKILCIDDFRPGLDTRKVFLEQFGFEVMTAGSGQDGLRLLREDPADVVILDYRMPEMNGFDVALAIRQEFGDIPILLLSGYAREIPPELKKIVSCHLTKGDPPSILLSALDELTRTTAEQRRAVLRSPRAASPSNAKQKRRTG